MGNIALALIKWCVTILQKEWYMKIRFFGWHRNWIIASFSLLLQLLHFINELVTLDKESERKRIDWSCIPHNGKNCSCKFDTKTESSVIFPSPSIPHLPYFATPDLQGFSATKAKHLSALGKIHYEIRKL